MTRLRALAARETGMTLVEVMVTMMMLSIVMVVFFGVLVSIQNAVVRQDNLSRTNDQARLALEQLDREIRSGNVLYDPASENPANYTLRIYTQSNATTRTPSPGYWCTLWTINSSQQLVTRVWPPLQPENATPWRVVAEGIVNRVVSPTVLAFWIDADPNKGGRTVDMKLVVNQDLTNRPTQTITVQTSSTGRNTSYGFPQSVCATTPT